MKLIEKEWNGYRRQVLKDVADDAEQLREVRHGFYAGAVAFYSLVMRIIEPGLEPTEHDLGMMAALDAELRQYAERVRRGQE